MNGVIVVDKPQDWTSHDVVGKLRRLAGTKKIGHLGTLDPLATGVLPLLIDRATRLAQFFARNEKVYEGEVCFGWPTTTYDSQGEATAEAREVCLDAEQAEHAFAPFRGTFLQVPPPVSAKKINGRPAYELARKKIEVALAAVEVRVDELEILSIESPRVKIRVRCSAGTYLRAIAHEAGARLGCGAHLSALRRTQSGSFGIGQAYTIEQLTKLSEAAQLRQALIPASELLPEFSCETLDSITVTQVRQGRDFRVSPFRNRGEARYVKALDRDGELVAIGEVVLPNIYHPLLVL